MNASATRASAAHRPRGGGPPASVDPAPEPPADLRPKVTLGDGVRFPEELLDDDPPNSVLRVFRVLSESCARFASSGTYVYRTTIAKKSKLSASAVRVAIRWLEARGWVARSPVRVRDEDREMFWCLWLLRAPLEAGEVDFGHGFRFRLEDGRVVPPSERPALVARPRDGAEICGGGAEICAIPSDPCAQKSAPQNRKWTLLEEPTLTLRTNENDNAAPPGGGGEPGAIVAGEAGPIGPEVGADPAPAAGPPPAAPAEGMSAGRVAELVETVRSRQPASLRKLAYWTLEESGRLPEDLAGSFPPRKPEPPPRVAPRPAVAASPKDPAPAAAAPTTLERLRRLGPPSGPEDLDAICRAICAEWDDWRSLGCHRARLGLVRSEAVSRKFAVGLYQECRAANLPPRSRAKLWNSRFSAELERLGIRRDGPGGA